MSMPNRNVEGDYRYAYQGQEKDAETGKEAFQLRLWDSRIGRWLTTDPYSQFYSSYLGMGNSPVYGTDPDGGIFIFKNPKAEALWEKYKKIISLTERGRKYIETIENDQSFEVLITDEKTARGETFGYSVGNMTLHLGENLNKYEVSRLQKDMSNNKIHSTWIFAGHELFHIIQHYNYDTENGKDAFLSYSQKNKGTIEREAVLFQNYLYSTSSNGDDFRESHGGVRARINGVWSFKSDDHIDFNPRLEKIHTIDGKLIGSQVINSVINKVFTITTFGDGSDNKPYKMLSPRYF